MSPVSSLQLGVLSSPTCLHLYRACGPSEPSKLRRGSRKPLMSIRTCTRVHPQLPPLLLTCSIQVCHLKWSHVCLCRWTRTCLINVVIITEAVYCDSVFPCWSCLNLKLEKKANAHLKCWWQVHNNKGSPKVHKKDQSKRSCTNFISNCNIEIRLVNIENPCYS